MRLGALGARRKSFLNRMIWREEEGEIRGRGRGPVGWMSKEKRKEKKREKNVRKRKEKYNRSQIFEG